MKMETAPTTDSSVEPAASVRAEFASEVVQQIRQHARSSMKAEICGVLIGRTQEGVTHVTARIAGEGAAQGGAHVTFTQNAWEHIYKVKDAEYPSLSIVGWYHSHPGFGIFLSDYDLFIHENFFNAPHQLAWVFDPHSDEEGCFGWIGKKVGPIEQIAVVRKHRQPTSEQTQEEAAGRKAEAVVPPSASQKSGTAGESAPAEERNEPPRRSPGIGLALIVGVLAFSAGFAVPHFRPAWEKAVWSRIRLPGPHTEPAPPASPFAPGSPKD
jgi:proteasome lid subunit RPN8/RPN11